MEDGPPPRDGCTTILKLSNCIIFIQRVTPMSVDKARRSPAPTNYDSDLAIASGARDAEWSLRLESRYPDQIKIAFLSSFSSSRNNELHRLRY